MCVPVLSSEPSSPGLACSSDHVCALTAFPCSLAENGFLGMGVGAAMTGLRPIVEGMNMGFLLLAFNQISNNCGMLHYTSGGQYKASPHTGLPPLLAGPCCFCRFKSPPSLCQLWRSLWGPIHCLPFSFTGHGSLLSTKFHSIHAILRGTALQTSQCPPFCCCRPV